MQRITTHMQIHHFAMDCLAKKSHSRQANDIPHRHGTPQKWLDRRNEQMAVTNIKADIEAWIWAEDEKAVLALQ